MIHDLFKGLSFFFRCAEYPNALVDAYGIFEELGDLWRTLLSSLEDMTQEGRTDMNQFRNLLLRYEFLDSLHEKL